MTEAVRQDGGRGCVIFLDMDGVISTWRAHKAQPEKPLPDRWIDAEAMANLNRLCEQSGASVVISSTWRLNRTREEFQTILSRNGFTGALHHCWRTKDMAAPIGSGGLWWAVIRGDEVRAWLSDHPADEPIDEEWVAAILTAARSTAPSAEAMRAALVDMLAGWRYIREHHGDLYGVGWDRCEEAATKALALPPAQSPAVALSSIPAAEIEAVRKLYECVKKSGLRLAMAPEEIAAANRFLARLQSPTPAGEATE